MKKQFLLLAGTAIILASCGGNKTEPAGQSQAQIDSAINATVAAHDAAVAAKNDSTLKAIEAEKAAAEAKANEGHHSGGTKKHEAASPAPTPAPPPPPGGLRGHADNAQPAQGTQGTQGKPASGGLRSHADNK
jgi:hypothetical protein